MIDDVRTFVQVTYFNALRSQQDSTAAFERAVGVLLGRRRELTDEEARREVARVLGDRRAESVAR